MAKTDQCASVPTAHNVRMRPGFCIDQLRIFPGSSVPEQHRRREAVRELFGWESVEELEGEYRTSVEPYYHLISHHHRQDPAEVIQLFLDKRNVAGIPQRVPPPSRLTPLDVFSLPFRLIRTGQRFGTLAVDYNLRCAPLGGTSDQT